ncbi:MAG: hypothetical protein ACOYPR_01245, partial [Saprospiraceae bacterium]
MKIRTVKFVSFWGKFVFPIFSRWNNYAAWKEQRYVRNLGQIYTCTADTGCYNYYGLSLCQEGNFQEVLTSYLGCDS